MNPPNVTQGQEPVQPNPAPAGSPAPAKEPAEADLDAMFDAAYQGKPADEPQPKAGDSPEPQQKAEPAPAPVPAQPEPAKAAPSPTPEPAPQPAPKAEPQPQPTPQPEPQPSPEDDDEKLRADALEAERIGQRLAREYTRRTGKPLRDMGELAAEVEGERALAALREEFPDIYKALMHSQRGVVRREDLEELSDDLRGQVEEGTITTAQEAQITRVAAAHPGWGRVLQSPEKLTLVTNWIDELPGKKSREIEHALTVGTEQEANAALDEFLAAKGLKTFNELFTSEPTPAQPAAAPAQPAAPEVKPAPVNAERLEAAQAIPGEGTHAPAGSAQPMPLGEKDLDQAWEREYARA